MVAIRNGSRSRVNGIFQNPSRFCGLFSGRYVAKTLKAYRRTTYAFPFLPSLVTYAAHLQNMVTPCGFKRYKSNSFGSHLSSVFSLSPFSLQLSQAKTQLGSSVDVIPRKDKRYAEIRLGRSLCLSRTIPRSMRNWEYK